MAYLLIVCLLILRRNKFTLHIYTEMEQHAWYILRAQYHENYEVNCSSNRCIEIRVHYLLYIYAKEG